MKRFAIFIIFIMMLSTVNSFAKEVSFTQEDRERLRNIELKVERLEEGQKAINQRIDDLRDLIYVVIGGIIALVGFVIWDRRTALQPAIKKAIELTLPSR